MIDVQELWKSFGGQDLFRDAEIRVNRGDRTAIVGPNGSGKTTLFEMIAGNEAPDRGLAQVKRDTEIGYLRQETDRLRGRSVLEEVLSGRPELVEASARLHHLEESISKSSATPRLLKEYGDLRHTFETRGGYSVESEARRILAGLGFKDEDASRMTDAFSGGWLMRIALAKLLVAKPDVLLLDEPTNHLDLASVEWLEGFLRAYGGTVLFTSHDREFINGFARKIVEVRDHNLYEYVGDYDDFVAQRELSLKQASERAKQQKRVIDQSTRFIERFRYKKTKARQVQSRIKTLEKMDRVVVPKTRTKSMHLKFPTPPRSGRLAIELEEIHFAYPSSNGEGSATRVFSGVDLVIEGNWKVALVGPNGAGKTTLLKLLAGVLEPTSGIRRLGQNSVVGYFAQHQIESLDPIKTVIEEMEAVLPPAGVIEARDLLGRFLFSGDDVRKRVSVLSGGERTKLAMAKMLASPNNFLCLDEPTNHLDMQSRDVVGEALSEFPGSMVLITHDRNLIREVANRIVEVVAGRVRIFDGDYDYYLSKRESEEQPQSPSKTSTKKAPVESAEKKTDSKRVSQIRARQLRARVAQVERELETAEKESAELANRLADPETYSTNSGEDIPGLIAGYEAASARIRDLESRWEDLSKRLELFERSDSN